jgi:hypothetical protein
MRKSHKFGCSRKHQGRIAGAPDWHLISRYCFVAMPAPTLGSNLTPAVNFNKKPVLIRVKITNFDRCLELLRTNGKKLKDLLSLDDFWSAIGTGLNALL